jgi:hypothetical protein
MTIETMTATQLIDAADMFAALEDVILKHTGNKNKKMLHDIVKTLGGSVNALASLHVGKGVVVAQESNNDR